MTVTDDLTLSTGPDEYPHPVRPDVPLWSENYAFVCFDGDAGVGVFHHVGRAPHNPDIWRGTSFAMLPGQELVISKSLGLPNDPRAPGTPIQTATCLEPLERWRLSHDGAGLLTSRADPAAGLIGGADAAHLAYDLEWEAMHPIWDLTDWMREQEWGHAHIEQGCRVRGSVTAGDTTYEFDGTGFRDHTLGPRNFANLNRTCWAHAEFPSGRVFCALRIWSPDDQVVLNQGFAYADGEMRLLEPGEMPTIHGSDGAPHDVRVELGEGAVEITGEVVHSMAFMMEEPNDLLAGTDHSRLDTKVIVEAATRYEWDGEVGYGWLERSRRIDQL